MPMHVSTCAQVLGLLNRWDWPSWMVGWTGVGVESLFVTALLWRIIKTAVVPISTVFHLQPIFNKLYMYLSVFAVIFIVLTEMTFEYQTLPPAAPAPTSVQSSNTSCSVRPRSCVSMAHADRQLRVPGMGLRCSALGLPSSQGDFFRDAFPLVPL